MHQQQQWIAHWREQNAIAAQQVPAALRLAGIPPSQHEWRVWIDRLLLWLGVAALLAGLIFFVAANWSGMGHLGKLALAEAAVAVSLAAYVWGARFRYANAALLAASLAVGALLALIGQIYQTGADTYQLFVAWAVLIFVWVLMARLPALWVLWLAILHVAIVFYLKDFNRIWFFSLEWKNVFVAVALFDCGVLVAWEWLAAQGRTWMRGRWVPRSVALTAGIVATILAIFVIVDKQVGGFYFLVYMAMLTGMYAGYRHKRPDLFMLAGGALSAIVVATTGLGRVLLENIRGREPTGEVFLLGLFAMLATAAAAWWLRQVARDFKNKSANGNGEEISP